MQLQDNVFFVTGGASGLGEATARMLVESGACVVIADVNEPSGEPRILLYGHVASMLKQSAVHLSLSHTKSTVVAFVVIEKKGKTKR